MWNCDQLQDADFVVIGEKMPQLQLLSVAATPIAAAGLGAIVAGCPRLSWLDIGWCRQLTDADIALVAQCSGLRFLNAQRTAVSVDTLDHIVRSCASLTEIHVASCAALTSDDAKQKIEELRSKYGSVSIKE